MTGATKAEPAPLIKVKARVVIRRGEDVLLEHRTDPSARPCLRPIGGNVEFGERGADAIEREFREETGLTLKQVRFLACVEDLGANSAGQWHEICLLYLASMVDATAYHRESIPIHEDTDRQFTAYWVPIAALRSETALRRMAAPWASQDVPEIRPHGLYRRIQLAPPADVP